MVDLLVNAGVRRGYDRLSTLDIVFLVCFLFYATNTIAVVSSGTHSVVSKGDLLVLSKVTSDSISIGNIIAVKDPSRSLPYYVQRVTQVDFDNPTKQIVEIQYQPEHSENLERRWIRSDGIVGKVVFRIPYLAILQVLVHENKVQLLAVLLIWVIRPWESLITWPNMWTPAQAKIMMGALILFSLPKPVM